MAAVPLIQRLERGVRQRALQVAGYSGDVTQILRLAVAHVEACEDAEDLRCALRGQRDVAADEGAGIELGIVGASAARRART